jgi:hypothetical protein
MKYKNKDMATRKKTTSQMVSADITTAQPLVLTQGNLIEGTFDVVRTDTEDILTGVVTNWNGLWHDYHFNNVPEFTIPTGGQGATNYGGWQQQIATPFTFKCIVPHNGEQKSYFFGVSSDGGRNVAGKTLIVG